jgi:Tfp pilus assembly protein PilO
MSDPTNRDTISHGVIIVAACVGAWLLFVQPNAREIAQHEATIAAAQSNTGAMSQSDVESAAQKMSQIRQRLDHIRRQNELSSDSSRLFGQIMDLAQKHGVKIQHMSPGSIAKGADPNGVAASRIEMAAQGRFDDLAAFLEAVDEMEGFIRPVSLAMVPLHEEGPGMLTIRFSCEAVTFAMPSALAAMTGGTNGQR